MEDRVVVVTGATGGIGSATVIRLSEDGYRVVAVDRAVAEEKFHELGLSEERVTFHHVSVSDRASVESLFEQLEKEFGRIHGLVNNAGVALYKGAMETGEEEWDEVFAVNIKAIYSTVRHGARLMPAGGSIVNVGSVHSVVTGPRHAAYAASKGAVEAITRSLALELSKKHIRVNCVLPGAVRTTMLLDGLAGENAMEALVRRTPLARVGEPEEIAAVIAFLLGPESSFMTGSVVVADGGATALLATETLR